MVVSWLSYFQLSGFAVLGYDYCLTLSQEVERVWKQKLLAGPTLLFLVNRYLGLIYQIICLALTIKESEIYPAYELSEILPSQRFEDITTVILVIVCELIMSIRVYALYGCNRTLLCFLLTLIFAQLVLAVCFDFIPAAADTLQFAFLNETFFTLNSFVLWTSAIVIDTSVFILTLRKTHKFYKDSQSAPLLHLFFRDGLVYFLVIGTSNLVNIVVNTMPTLVLRDSTNWGGTQSAISSQFCTSITSLLVSRLVLNIRVGSDPDLYSTEHQRSTISALVIGNPGGSMDELFDEDMDEDRDEVGYQ